MNTYDQLLFVDREKKFRGFQKLLQPAIRQAVMVIEAPRDMGKTWLIGRMQRHCLKPEVNFPVAQVDFRNPRQIHEIQDFLGLIRQVRDQLGHPEYFYELNGTINSFSEAGLQDNRALAGLVRKIESSFNMEELENLSFELGITYENLDGRTLQGKSRALVEYSQRHGRLSALIQQCAQLRPGTDWWQGLERYQSGGGEVETAVDADTPIQDNNNPIWADSDMERRRARRQINDAFFTAVAQLMADKGQVVFLLDSFEEAPPEAERWLKEELLIRLRENQISDAVIIITGRKTPDLTNLDLKHLLVQTDLDPFNEDHIREYFEERRQLIGLDIRTIVVTSAGVPGALAMMADHAMSTADDDDDFFNDL